MPIKFPYDSDRASNATRWLLAQHGGRLDRLKLIKLVFLADRLHLAKYGRPIVGGWYCAMEHGPVASELLTALHANNLFGTVKDDYRVNALVPPDEDELSESDIEILSAIDAEYGAMDKYSLRDLTHEFTAWKKNYLGNNSSYPLSYEDFFLDLSEEDRGTLELLRDTQEAETALG